MFSRLIILFSISLVMAGLLLFACESGDDDDNASGGGDDNDDASGDTWTDSSSGLTWQVTPSTNAYAWDDAITYCQKLSLDGGGWHLPSISELRTLIRGCDATETGGSCGVTDSCLDYSCQDESCYSCEGGNGTTDGCYGPSELPGECDWFWSSSQVANFGFAWFVDFAYGYVYYSYVGNRDAGTVDSRCVR
jgi:uncharacterized protein (TIGR02145 family)